MNDKKLLNRVNELLSYNPDTGIFTWEVSRGCIKSGDIAGYLDPSGYITIRIIGKLYAAHRLAFLIINKYMPKEVDHENGVKDDNRELNLRDAAEGDNHWNRNLNCNSTSGFKGVTWYKANNKWVSGIRVNKKRIYLGYFLCPKEAAKAYDKAALKHHGEFAKTNKMLGLL